MWPLKFWIVPFIIKQISNYNKILYWSCMIWSAIAGVLSPEFNILFNPHAVLYHLSRCIHKFPPPHYAFAQIVGFTSGYYEIDANNRCLSVCNSLILYNVGTQPHWVKKLQYNYTFALHSYCMGRQSRILANTLLFFGLWSKHSTNYLVLSLYILELHTSLPSF